MAYSNDSIDVDNPPKKRKQVKAACVNCQKACKKCDSFRPCTRCIKYKFPEACVDAPRKERKKGGKRVKKHVSEDEDDEEMRREQEERAQAALAHANAKHASRSNRNRKAKSSGMARLHAVDEEGYEYEEATVLEYDYDVPEYQSYQSYESYNADTYYEQDYYKAQGHYEYSTLERSSSRASSAAEVISPTAFGSGSYHNHLGLSVNTKREEEPTAFNILPDFKKPASPAPASSIPRHMYRHDSLPTPTSTPTPPPSVLPGSPSDVGSPATNKLNILAQLCDQFLSTDKEDKSEVKTEPGWKRTQSMPNLSSLGLSHETVTAN